MSRDLRNEFINEVELALADITNAEDIITTISLLLERYELTERQTALIPCDTENTDLLKLYTSTLVIDGKAKSTIEQYVRELKHFVRSCGTRSIKEIGAFEIRNYLARRKMDGIANRRLDTIRTILNTFYGWLAAEEIITKNPCATVKPIKFTKEVLLPFSEIELDKMRSACRKPKERAVLEFLLASGVRRSELCDLDVEDIDFFKGKVHIRHGKGDKERYTYINDLAKEHLLKYLNGRTTGPLFLNRDKERYKNGGIFNLVSSLGKRAGVEDVHPHKFRRTFATTLASRGMSLQELQKLMGHTNINTTMGYVALSDTDIQYAYHKFA